MESVPYERLFHGIHTVCTNRASMKCLIPHIIHDEVKPSWLKRKCITWLIQYTLCRAMIIRQLQFVQEQGQTTMPLRHR